MGAGDSAVGLICGFALPLWEGETVQLVNSGIRTVISEEGGSAVGLICGFALPLWEWEAVRLLGFWGQHCHSWSGRQCGWFNLWICTAT